MDKYGKRWGVKTGTVELPNVEEAGRTIHSVDVTPEMKESVMQGQPLFSVTGIEAFERYPDDVYRTERVRKDLAELQLRYNLPRIHLFDETVTVEDLMAIDTTNDSEAEKRKIAEETLALVINKKMKGYYSPDTKEIAIFAQNISRPIILEQTLFHENFHGWVDHYSDKSRINIMLDELYAQGENLHKELYDALNEDDGYTKEERPKEFMAYYMSEAMILGDLEEDVYKYLSKDNQRLVDNFLNDIGYERSEEEPRRHKRDQEIKRIKSSKTKTQGANNGEVARTDREANPGESGDETRRISFSTSEAVDALKDDERVYNDLLGKVFSGVSNETRRGIVEDAMRNRGNDFGAATEAWLGGLADDGKFADVDRRDWGRVKLALHQALMDNGADVSEPLTDGESRYVLWKAGQIDDGVFSLAEDVVMRDRLLNGARAPQYTDSADVRFSTSKVEQMTPIEKMYPDMEDFKDNTSILFHYKWATRHLDEEWVAFYPEQIKSAEPITYDDEGNVIPLSERFDLENPDIRYSRSYSLGVPYQGTKDRIARNLMEKLPGGRRFVDLFAGGGAMTHAAMLSGKYEEYHMNNVNPIGVELFMQGLRGEWDDYNRTSMTPEEFKQLKGTPEAIPWSVLGLGRNLAKGGRRDYVNRVKRLGELKGQATG